MKRSEMFRERNERPSTAGEAEERSGYMELYAVAGGSSFPNLVEMMREMLEIVFDDKRHRDLRSVFP